MKIPKLLIGGSPTAGKSTTAKALSRELGIPWISTDQIRDLLIMTADPEQHPDLCMLNNFTAEEYLTVHTPQEIVERSYRWNDAVAPYLKNFLENLTSDWSDG